MTIHSTAKIHKTAIVDLGAKIGAYTKIWHWAHICGGALIEEGCSLGQNVFIGNYSYNRFNDLIFWRVGRKEEERSTSSARDINRGFHIILSININIVKHVYSIH